MHRFWYIILIICASASIVAISSCSVYEPANLPPIVDLDEATNITRTSAVLSGKVTLQKEGRVSSIEIIWGPVSGNMSNHIGFDPSNLSPAAEISGLRANTTYHYLLRAGNEHTQISSDTMEFTTQPNTEPVLENIRLLYCGLLSSTVACRIADNGGEEIQETGIIYWTDNDGTKYTNIAQYTGDEFICKLGNLSPNTTYNIRAYAKQNTGTGYSNTIKITTGETTVNVEKPGTISEIMDFNDASRLTGISISGLLDSDDIRFIRALVAPGPAGAIAAPMTSIDLSESRIVAGGYTYDNSHYTRNDTITPGMFANCRKLQTILLPAGTKAIDEDAFTGCSSLKEFHIPPYTSRIGHSHGCNSLSEFIVDNQNKHYSTIEGVLYNKDLTKLIWYPMGNRADSLQLPESVNEIGDHAFSEYPYPTVSLPVNIKKIGRLAFSNSLLEEIVLPDSISTIPYAIFQNSSELKYARFGTQTEYFSDYIFSGTPLEVLVIESELPPYCSKDAFNGFDTSKCTLYVKESSLQLYRNSFLGKHFRQIRAL